MDHITQLEFDRVTEQVFSELNETCTWTSEEREKFCALANFLLSENEKYNLTAIRTLDSVIKNHFFDSAAASVAIPKNAKIIDIGTGAGFPTLPLAIVRPDIRIIALDSTEKKVEFVKSAASLLSLPSVSTFCGRVCAVLSHEDDVPG